MLSKIRSFLNQESLRLTQDNDDVSLIAEIAAVWLFLITVSFTNSTNTNTAIRLIIFLIGIPVVGVATLAIAIVSVCKVLVEFFSYPGKVIT